MFFSVALIFYFIPTNLAFSLSIPSIFAPISCPPSPPNTQLNHHTDLTALMLFMFNTLPCHLKFSRVTVNSSEITTEEKPPGPS